MRRTAISTTLIFLIAACLRAFAGEVPHYSYHFDRPARMWEETLPLGNGRIGMTPDGGIEKEVIVLNESSLWSGSPQNADNPEAGKSLATIRQLLFEGRNDEAQAIITKTFRCGGKGTSSGKAYRVPYGCFQIFGNLVIEHSLGSGETTDYRRELTLDNAMVAEHFSRGGIRYERSYFASYNNDVCVIRLTADKRKAISFNLSMNRIAEREVPENWVPAVRAEGCELFYDGRLTDGTEKEGEALRGMKFGARIRIILPRGGSVSSADGKSLTVKEADEAVILVAMATNFYGDDIAAKLSAQLDKASRKSYGTLAKEHSKAFGALFDRVSVDFGHDARREAMPVDERLNAFAADGCDPSLLALYYQFGRYLLISSTRPGCLPPNLQGLWAHKIQTPWNCDYHLNINLQMNLWPAETANLPELLLPFTAFTESLVKSGQHTAQVFYGARGWTVHPVTNVWGFTSPGESPGWGATNTSAAWLCEHLYNHYLYTLDKEYLRRVYPTMKESALFFVDMLVENPNNHYLVTAPTTSPENRFILPNGVKCSVVAGSTMDNQIVRELFGNVAASAAILGIDQAFADTLKAKMVRLKPTTIGEDGRIMEWMEPYKEREPTHRHVSHLYGLYPANEISVNETPELAEAARKTLEVRGDVSTGWSMGWKINFWARLHDGEHCYKLLKMLLRPVKETGFNYSNGGGTYPNLFCAHPPMQIDGNFGGCAGIAEMLIQSQDGYIELLPALPAALGTGSFKGLCVRGGGEVDLTWKDGAVSSIRLKAKHGGKFFIKGFMAEPVELKAGRVWKWKAE